MCTAVCLFVCRTSALHTNVFDLYLKKFSQRNFLSYKYDKGDFVMLSKRYVDDVCVYESRAFCSVEEVK